MIRLEDVAATVPAAPGEAAPREVLRSVNATFAPGESHLLLGGNGSGKTTLLRVLAGLAAPTSGRVVREPSPPGAKSASLWPDIAILFEEPDPQFLGYSVESEVAFGLESMGLPADETRARTRDALEELGIIGLAERAPHSLSAGEKARTLLAAVLAGRPGVLLLDQALAHLDPDGRRVLEERIVREALSGARVVIRTEQDGHAPYPGEILHVLEQGTLRPASALTPHAVEAATHVPFPLPLRIAALLARQGRWSGPLVSSVEALVSRLETDRSPGDPAAQRRTSGGAGAPGPSGQAPRSPSGPDQILDPSRMAVEVESVSWTPPGRGAQPVLSGITLSVARGETVALVGRSGAGKSTLLRLVCGLDAPSSGSIRRPPPRVPRTRGVALALEYPERQLFGRTVLEDVAALLWVEGVHPEERARSARRALAEMGLDPDRYGERFPLTLSEGEKRRVALAGVLVEPPSVLLLDEPTAGLDPEGRRDLARAIRALRDRGRAILFASHDLDFVSAVADRVVVLARDGGQDAGAATPALAAGPGSIVGEGPTNTVLRDENLLSRAGVPPPDFIRLERALRAAGLLAPHSIRDAESLLAALAAGAVRDEAIEGERLPPRR